MQALFAFLAFSIYLTSWIGFIFFFKTQKKEALKYAQLVLFLGFCFHSLFWILRIYEISSTLILSFKDILNFLAWILVFIYFIFTFTPIKAYTVGFFLLPLILILFTFFYLFPSKLISPFGSHLKSFWFPLHALAGLISHGFLLFGVTVSLMYLLQEREIKKKQLGMFFKKLPPLEYLDKLIEKCLYLGFIFLTFAIMSGVVWNKETYDTYWKWSPKEIITLILWVIYIVLIHQRLIIGWRGKKAAYMFLLGFTMWFISFFVINLFLKGFHTYGF